jgi:hypothetical protein
MSLNREPNRAHSHILNILQFHITTTEHTLKASLSKWVYYKTTTLANVKFLFDNIQKKVQLFSISFKVSINLINLCNYPFLPFYRPQTLKYGCIQRKIWLQRIKSLNLWWKLQIWTKKT